MLQIKLIKSEFRPQFTSLFIKSQSNGNKSFIIFCYAIVTSSNIHVSLGTGDDILLVSRSILSTCGTSWSDRVRGQPIGEQA